MKTTKKAPQLKKQVTEIINLYSLPKKGISKVSDEDLVSWRTEMKEIVKGFNKIFDEVIDAELFRRADRYKEGKYDVGNNKVMIVSYPLFNYVPLPYAHKVGAIKEVPDSEILRELWDAETKDQPRKEKKSTIPGVKMTEYATIK